MIRLQEVWRKATNHDLLPTEFMTFHTKKTRFSQASRARFTNSRQLGFSMIEVLIIVAIIALIGAAMYAGLLLQNMKARDGRRKADLVKLKIAFENYYNDNNCYPPANIFNNGGSAPSYEICNKPLAALQPYLQTVPCDPTTGMPYLYLPPESGNICNGYRVYTKLENDNDGSIMAVGCYKGSCGIHEPYLSHNYGISVGTAIPEAGFESGVIPAAIPTGFNGNFVCSPDTDGNANGGRPYCKDYTVVAGHGCGASFSTIDICQKYCQVGSPIICSD